MSVAEPHAGDLQRTFHPTLQEPPQHQLGLVTRRTHLRLHCLKKGHGLWVLVGTDSATGESRLDPHCCTAPPPPCPLHTEQSTEQQPRRELRKGVSLYLGSSVLVYAGPSASDVPFSFSFAL